MRRILFLTAIFILALTLVVCGADDNNGTDANRGTDVTNNENQDHNAVDNQGDNNTNDTATDNNNVSGEVQTKMDEFDYVDFELSVEYNEDKEFEANLEKNQYSGVEADLEDQLNGVHIDGQEAFDKI